jgi:hypothetical protein
VKKSYSVKYAKKGTTTEGGEKGTKRISEKEEKEEGILGDERKKRERTRKNNTIETSNREVGFVPCNLFLYFFCP